MDFEYGLNGFESRHANLLSDVRWGDAGLHIVPPSGPDAGTHTLQSRVTTRLTGRQSNVLFLYRPSPRRPEVQISFDYRPSWQFVPGGENEITWFQAQSKEPAPDGGDYEPFVALRSHPSHTALVIHGLQEDVITLPAIPNDRWVHVRISLRAGTPGRIAVQYGSEPEWASESYAIAAQGAIYMGLTVWHPMDATAHYDNVLVK